MTDNEFREYIDLNEAWEMLEELAEYVERDSKTPKSAEKEAVIGELRDQIEQWQDKLCQVVEAKQMVVDAKDTIKQQRDEARLEAKHYLKLQLETRENVGRYRKERDEARQLAEELANTLSHCDYEGRPMPKPPLPWRKQGG
jgi:hypothetical protein